MSNSQPGKNLNIILRSRETGRVSHRVFNQKLVAVALSKDSTTFTTQFEECISFLNFFSSKFPVVELSTITDIIQKLFSEIRQATNTSQIECILQFGHIETLLHILVQDLMGGRRRDRNQPKPYPILTCQTEHINIIHQLLIIVQDCLRNAEEYSVLHLSNNYELLEALFSLVTHQPSTNLYRLREAVVSLTDFILCQQHDLDPVPLTSINGLSEMIQSDTGIRNTQVFHILSAMLSVSEYNAMSHLSLVKHDAWIVESGYASVMESNHKFLLDQPLWLENMCKIACRTMSEATHSVEAVNHIFSRLEIRVDQSIDLQTFAEDPDSLLYQVLLYKEKTLRGDIFLLLSLLLSGKYREEVQDRLLKCVCLQFLPLVFKEIVWTIFQGHANLLVEGSDGDTTDVDMFIRIQFLRFIYSIADNHKNRYLLMSLRDVRTLQKIANNYKIEFPESLKKVLEKSPTPFDEQPGILMNLISALKQEPASSCVCFWITRGLESFLRGEIISLIQAFLLEQDLVEITVNLIISRTPQNEIAVQGSFDFLSTLMKFNIEAFKRCSNVLDCTDKLQTLLRLVNNNLVDSNMFIRCIILTAAYIKENEPNKINFLTENKLLKYFSGDNKQVDYVVKLTSILTVPTLSQENVSCLNTGIAIMILAHRRHLLSHYLSEISKLEDGVKLLKNMKSLMTFWLRHYTLPIKQSDCKSLETSTGIKIDEWKTVVNELLVSDPKKDNSLEYYLQKSRISESGRRFEQSPTLDRLS